MVKELKFVFLLAISVLIVECHFKLLDSYDGSGTRRIIINFVVITQVSGSFLKHSYTIEAKESLKTTEE